MASQPTAFAAVLEVVKAVPSFPKVSRTAKWYPRALKAFGALAQQVERAPEKVQAASAQQALRDLFIAMPAEHCAALPEPALAAVDGVLLESRAAAGPLTTIDDAANQPGSVVSKAKGMIVWRGDMARLQCDAVVNPGNAALLGCFQPDHKCLDNILHGASGPRLRIACSETLRRLQIAEEQNGQCRVTDAYCLPSKHVFHTVGPCLLFHPRAPPRDVTPVDQQELRSCYETCFQTAVQMKLSSIAFCCISTGIFGYPAEAAATLAVETVLRARQAAIDAGEKPPLVIFNVFKPEDLEIYTRIFASL